jgi:GxxExxY protein
VNLNTISGEIVDSAVAVHRTLGGPGLLEKVYAEALVCELTDRGFLIERELAVPIQYKGRILSTPLRLDLLVQRQVIVEVKATVAYNKLFEAQALTYLRLLNLKLALVINFGERLVRDGIHRVVNEYKETL